MGMPGPTDEHRRLERLAGSWAGEEIVHPSPWDPGGGPATGRTLARMSLGGFFLISDYEQERDGKVNFRGHGVYGWDTESNLYTMHWFDSLGIDPGDPGTGAWEGDVLTFTHGTFPRGRSRHVYRIGSDEYHLRIEQLVAKMGWRPFLEGTYRRVS